MPRKDTKCPACNNIQADLISCGELFVLSCNKCGYTQVITKGYEK